jgi:hypothetical protein
VTANRDVSGRPGHLQCAWTTQRRRSSPSAEHFISSRGCGIGGLVKDASIITDKLQQTADGYTGTDQQIADSMRGGDHTRRGQRFPASPRRRSTSSNDRHRPLPRRSGTHGSLRADE